MSAPRFANVLAVMTMSSVVPAGDGSAGAARIVSRRAQPSRRATPAYMPRTRPAPSSWTSTDICPTEESASKGRASCSMPSGGPNRSGRVPSRRTSRSRAANQEAARELRPKA